MPAKSTAEQICTYLSTQPAASAHELSRVLGLTVPNIRHHLELLVQSGRVANIGKRGSGGRGRPIEYYALTPQTRHNNYANLAKALLQTLSAGQPEEYRSEKLKQTAEYLAARWPGQIGSLTARLNQVVNTLNAMHYQCRWEAHADGPRVYVEHCPYQTLSAELDELCEIDRFLLEGLLRTSCQPLQHIDPQAIKATQCIFHIEP